MKGKDSAENKGFAFVTFRRVELASKAINELNGSEFKVRITSHILLTTNADLVLSKNTFNVAADFEKLKPDSYCFLYVFILILHICEEA